MLFSYECNKVDIDHSVQKFMKINFPGIKLTPCKARIPGDLVKECLEMRKEEYVPYGEKGATVAALNDSKYKNQKTRVITTI